MKNTMKKSLLNAIMILVLLSLSSCMGDGPAPMIWEFADYDKSAVSAVYAPDYYNQVTITAAAGYSGEITLRCTNYPQLTIDTNTDDGKYVDEKAGFAVSMVGGNTLKVTFMPVENVGESGAQAFVGITGRSGKDRNGTNMSVGRIKK